MGDSVKKILIVEDNAVQALMLKHVVEEYGHQIIGMADRGQEAVEQAAKLNPNLIIMDVFLNGDMTGIQAMQKICRHSPIPVVYISGNSDPFYVQKAKKQGCVDFLHKPIKNSDLRQVFAKVFEKETPSLKKQKSTAVRWAWPFSFLS